MLTHHILYVYVPYACICNTPFPNSLIMQKLELHISVAKKASDSNTLSASLLKFKISHPLEKKKCIFLTWKSYGQTLYKKSACPTLPRFQEIVNFQTLIKSDQNMISF